MVALITGHVFYILPNTLQGTMTMTVIRSSGEKKIYTVEIHYFSTRKKKIFLHS